MKTNKHRLILSQASIKEPAGGATIRVTEVSQHGQTVLVRIICDQIPHGGELAPVFSGPLIEQPYVLPAEVTNVDCLLMPAPHTYEGKTIAGTNVLSGKPDFLLGFMLPDEQAAAAAIQQVEKLNLGKLHGVDSPLFVLRRNLGKDANGKRIYEEIVCWIGMQAKSSPRKSKAPTSNLSFSSTTNFYIGQSYFPKGDSIEITSVERSENQMTVKGHYVLASHDQATLALYITTKTNIAVPVGPNEKKQISKGRGDFELSRFHLVPGLPHISMYDNHHAFAGIYFGTKAEAAEEGELNLHSDFSFGPVVERVLNLNDNGITDVLDLDSGKVVAAPRLESALGAAFVSAVMPTGVSIISQTTKHPMMLSGNHE